MSSRIAIGRGSAPYRGHNEVGKKSRPLRGAVRTIRGGRSQLQKMNPESKKAVSEVTSTTTDPKEQGLFME